MAVCGGWLALFALRDCGFTWVCGGPGATRFLCWLAGLASLLTLVPGRFQAGEAYEGPGLLHLCPVSPASGVVTERAGPRSPRKTAAPATPPPPAGRDDGEWIPFHPVHLVKLYRLLLTSPFLVTPRQAGLQLP